MRPLSEGCSKLHGVDGFIRVFNTKLFLPRISLKRGLPILIFSSDSCLLVSFISLFIPLSEYARLNNKKVYDVTKSLKLRGYVLELIININKNVYIIVPEYGKN